VIALAIARPAAAIPSRSASQPQCLENQVRPRPSDQANL
jgi:hypothetical protein